jgi:hypothetical protein
LKGTAMQVVNVTVQSGCDEPQCKVFIKAVLGVLPLILLC